MKFVVAVVMLALAAGVQSSLIGAYAPGVSYVTSAVHGAGWPYGGPPAAVAVHGGPWGAWGNGAPWGAWGNGAWGNGAWGYPSGYPGISLSQGPAHGVAPLAIAAHGHGHEGVYVAKTRGAIHTAPLAGHVNSATSLNLAPAPGTH